MKLIGNLLLTVSLITGMISAATSYLGHVEASEQFVDDGEPALLKAPAGSIAPTAAELTALRAQYEAGEITAEAYTAGRKARTPILGPDEDDGGTKLDAARLAQLETANVETVYTKGFSFARWRHWWIFLLSAIGLLTGSLLVRKADKDAIAAAAAAAGGTGSPGSPDVALASLSEVVATLRADLTGPADEREHLDTILERISEAQRTHIETFIDARPLLVGRMGLGGYAELMDRFAAAERQINRAWSAAADGVLEESVDCITNADELLQQAQTKM